MKIFRSWSNFELSAVLTDLECVLYREACRTNTPVSIPEFDDQIFIVKEINPCQEGDAQKNSWHLLIKPQAAGLAMGKQRQVK
jgi:hypothetical protein